MNVKKQSRPSPAKSPSGSLVLEPMATEIRPEQSIELLKELHILTRDGKLNQDSRRKLDRKSVV
jgi:hypothetical protein